VCVRWGVCVCVCELATRKRLGLFNRAYVCGAPMQATRGRSHTAACCNTLHHAATHCNTLQHTAPHCTTLYHTAAHCNTLQHTATHCNTLHHAATHCNTLQLKESTTAECRRRLVDWGGSGVGPLYFTAGSGSTATQRSEGLFYGSLSWGFLMGLFFGSFRIVVGLF